MILSPLFADISKDIKNLLLFKFFYKKTEFIALSFFR